MLFCIFCFYTEMVQAGETDCQECLPPHVTLTRNPWHWKLIASSKPVFLRDYWGKELTTTIDALVIWSIDHDRSLLSLFMDDTKVSYHVLSLVPYPESRLVPRRSSNKILFVCAERCTRLVVDPLVMVFSFHVFHFSSILCEHLTSLNTSTNLAGTYNHWSGI